MVKGGFERRIDDDNEQTFHFVMSSEDVLRVCKTEYIFQYVKQQHHSYLGHIARQKNISIVKKLLFKDNTNKKIGRPIKTLEDHVLNGRDHQTSSLKRLCEEKEKEGYGWPWP